MAPAAHAVGRKVVRLIAGFRRASGGAVAVEYAVLIGMVTLVVVGIVAVAAAVTGLFDDLPPYFS